MRLARDMWCGDKKKGSKLEPQGTVKGQEEEEEQERKLKNNPRSTWKSGIQIKMNIREEGI